MSMLFNTRPPALKGSLPHLRDQVSLRSRLETTCNKRAFRFTLLCQVRFFYIHVIFIIKCNHTSATEVFCLDSPITNKIYQF